MNVGPKCPCRVTTWGMQPAGGVFGALAGARTEFHRGPHSTLVQRAWHAAMAVDASAVEECASLAT
jgi:hypothetical protein